MKLSLKECRSTVIPGIRYRNAMAMIDWLCETFGFEKQAVYTGPGDIVMHAQLTFGNGMIMVSSVDNGTEAASVMKQEDEIGGAETQTPYLVVADCDAMYAHAKAAGGEDSHFIRKQRLRRQGLLVQRPRRAHLAHRRL